MALNLPTMAQVAAARTGPIEKGKTRLEIKAEKKPLTKVDDKQFRKEVHERDGKRCRCCERKVLATMEHIPERREIHHIHGRRGALRFESRAALQLCLRCHQRVTGTVNDKLILVPTKTFVMFSESTRKNETYTDARFKVDFKVPA